MEVFEIQGTTDFFNDGHYDKEVKYVKFYNGNDLLVHVLYKRKTGNYSRHFLISSCAVSRHVDLQNVVDCLNGIKSFSLDAFIFVGENAKSDINLNILRNALISPDHKMLIEKYRDRL